MLKNLEPHGIFRSNFAYLLYSFLNCADAGMQNGDNALPSIIFAGQGLLVKMLKTLE